MQKQESAGKISKSNTNGDKIQRFRLEPLRDPIHNYIDYNQEIEKKIIDTFIFQRLRRLYQLQSGRFVYPGATHSRFEHSLGAMHIGGEFAEQVLFNPLSEFKTKYEKSYLIEAVRLASLLHDIGHGPFSHAFDDAIISPSKTLSEKGIQNHEDLGRILIQKSDKISKALKKKNNQDISDNYQEIILKLLAKEKLPPDEDDAIIALRHIVKDFIYPADILDFLQRDGYFTGAKEFGFIDCDRLIRSTLLRGSDLVLEGRALESCQSLFDCRFLMFKNVYFHRTCRAIDHMVVKTMRLVNKSLKLEERVEKCLDGDIDSYLELDDNFLLREILRLKSNGNKDVINAQKMVKQILSRNIPWRLLKKTNIPFEQDKIRQYRLAKKGIEEKKIELEKMLEEKFSKNISKKEDVFFVDHSEYKYLPDSPFEISGKILSGKVKGKEYVIEEVPISKFFEERRSCFNIEFRVYVNKDLHNEKREKMEETVEESFEELFGQSSVSLGVTM